MKLSDVFLYLLCALLTLIYLLTKVILGQQKANINAPSLTVISDPEPLDLKYGGTYEGLGISPTDSTVFGAVAFGFDFYPRFHIPRLLITNAE
jgi:hypothetical protein